MKKRISAEQEEYKNGLVNSIIRIRDDVMEEFDMIEMIEDEIKTIFECDLNCVTCSREEQGTCMQNFKKANLYWIRKVSQDEQMLKGIVEKMDEMREVLEQAIEFTRDIVKGKNNEKYEKRLDEVKERKRNQSFYS